MMHGRVFRALLALAVLTTMIGSARAQEIKLLPVDEAAGDMSWVRFKNALLEAIEKHDKKFVLGVIDANIRNGPAAPSGIAEFKQQWDFDSEPKELFAELRSILFLGGVYVKERHAPRQFCGPYVAMKWPDDYDPYHAGAIVSKEVLVKESPSPNAKTIATLAYDIVGVPDWEVADEDRNSPQKWVKVSLKAREGYVPEEQIRSAIEHRACFQRTAHGWKLTALSAGE
jgi:hypothetical protein